jgi:large subunit ribosomal protein L25
MSQQATLKADKRTDAGKGVARKLRAAGQIPGVVYGQGEEALLLSLNAHDTMYLFENISVENTIVELQVEGEKGGISTLVREVQVHPFRSEILHVDFYKIQKGVTLDVNVPLHVHGDAVGVRNDGGVLQQLAHDISVNTIPSNIPDELVLDVSALEIGDQLTVADLELPEGVTVDLDPDTVLVLVAAPRKVEEDEELEPDTEAPAEPEIVGEAGDASDEEDA